jgi:L-alanine-DL-glutamate epimerase-like enolase superfamily enzyme
LWDIKGKAAGVPVYRLLGGENRPIFTYATGGYYRPDTSNTDYGEELARFVELGYRAVKLKTGGGTVAEEAERIAAVRRAIGDKPLLMLDMNAAYDLPDCIEFARTVEPHRIFWLEEPLHWYLRPADFARLPAATQIPLAHGERELTRFTVRARDRPVGLWPLSRAPGIARRSPAHRGQTRLRHRSRLGLCRQVPPSRLKPDLN